MSADRLARSVTPSLVSLHERTGEAVIRRPDGSAEAVAVFPGVYRVRRMGDHPPSRDCECPECFVHFESERLSRFYDAPLGEPAVLDARPLLSAERAAILDHFRVPLHPPLNIKPPSLRLSMLRALIARSRLSVYAEVAAFIIVSCGLVYLVADAINTLPLWGALIWSR